MSSRALVLGTLGAMICCGCGSGGALGGGDDLSTAGATDGGAVADLAAPIADSASGDLATSAGGVRFSYTPQWKGVTSVVVLGGFGKPTDWSAMTPLVALKDDGSGTWTASADLPAGQYLYMFHVIGDAEGPANYPRYAIDPNNSDFAPCPAASPTFDKNAPNPCSQLTVPQPPPATAHHVRGSVLLDGAPASGYLVEIERDETMSHHYFANRVTTGAGGTFDLAVAPGSYRLQVLHPDWLKATDADRNPLVLQAMRRSLSSTFKVDTDQSLNGAEVAYHDYNKMLPQAVTDGGVPLPLTFTFTLVNGSTAARAWVYGTAGKNIGDPWWDSASGKATTAVWDGKFTTKQANEAQAKPGERYFWGTWQTAPHPDGGVIWNGESMVLPLLVQ